MKRSALVHRIAAGPSGMAQVSAALAAATGPVTVILEAGDWDITEPIRLPSDATLKGRGTLTRLRLADNVNQSVVTNADPENGNDNIAVQDLWIDGNNANNPQPTRDGPGPSGVALFNVNGFRVSNVHVQNPILHGFEFGAFGTPSKGTATGPGCRFGLIESCWAEGAKDDGFTVHDSSVLRFVGCHAQRPDPRQYGHQCGFELDDGAAQITLVGCTADGWPVGFNAKGHGGPAIPARDITFTGCIATNSTENGFTASNEGPTAGSGPARNITFTGCISQSETTHDAGWHIAGYQLVRIVGCITRNATFGVKVNSMHHTNALGVRIIGHANDQTTKHVEIIGASTDVLVS